MRQQLLIIDEIHLLGVPGRGPVLETIVCRAKQYIEQLQSPIRMVGISATIPNYTDIQRFMDVPDEGLFVFGDEFRPVPMSQFIVGLKELRQSKYGDSKKVKRLEMGAEQRVACQKHPLLQDFVDSV